MELAKIIMASVEAISVETSSIEDSETVSVSERQIFSQRFYEVPARKSLGHGAECVFPVYGIRIEDVW